MKRNRIRVLLKNKGIKTKELAENMGINVSTLNKKINGRVRFFEKDIENILSILQVPYEDVFNDEPLVSVVIGDKRFYIPEKSANDVIEMVTKEAI